MMRRLLDLNTVKKRILERKLQGGWDLQEMNELGVKGYIIRGHFKPHQDTNLRNLFDPIHRRWTPPKPNRLELPDTRQLGSHEPLVDVFEGKNEVKVYVELPLEDKNEVRLNVVEGGVEVKTPSFYKLIRVPANLDLEKASSTHKNRVLEVKIPKKNEPSRNCGKQTITIE